jgi:putative phosphoribosyl transferase
MARFLDRRDGGKRLAERLTHLSGSDVVVLGLPRGGVVVASEVARALHAPLDVLVVRKLGVPFRPELAMGAVGEGGVVIIDGGIVRAARVTAEEVASVRASEEQQVNRLVGLLRRGRKPIPLAGRTVVIVDDGIATGSTAIAACRMARSLGAGRLILAVPVIARPTIKLLTSEVDELVWLQSPSPFYGVGRWFEDFSQTSDADVESCLAENAAELAAADEPGTQPDARHGVDRDVTVRIGKVELSGHLVVPAPAAGVVLFAHGSGSSSRSPRNRAVAATLNAAGLGTLLFDLLRPAEASDRSNVFDIPLLADRLRGATRWVRDELGAGISLGYFGASTGAAAALVAAADPAIDVGAIVSRGGRVDLAGPSLHAVRAPTLLIVGGEDHGVLELNSRALGVLTCVARLEVVPGATHLFEEPGAIERVSQLAGSWFSGHLSGMVRAA